MQILFLPRKTQGTMDVIRRGSHPPSEHPVALPIYIWYSLGEKMDFEKQVLLNGKQFVPKGKISNFDELRRTSNSRYHATWLCRGEVRS